MTGRGREWGRKEKRVRKKGGDGVTCCLNIHALIWSCVRKSEWRTKSWRCPCPDRREREPGAPVMRAFWFALRHEQVVVGIICCMSTDPCGCDCFVVNLVASSDCFKYHLVNMTEVPLGKVRATKLVISSHGCSVSSVKRTSPWPLCLLKELSFIFKREHSRGDVSSQSNPQRKKITHGNAMYCTALFFSRLLFICCIFFSFLFF